MTLAFTLFVMGVLLLMDRMGIGYGLREGWYWLIIALGIGHLFQNGWSFTGLSTMMIGLLILGNQYYSMHFSVPYFVKTYFLPVLLIMLGLLWCRKYRKN